jgi:hypothetical protein
MKPAIKTLCSLLLSSGFLFSCGPSSNNRVTIPKNELAQDGSLLPLPANLPSQVAETIHSIGAVIRNPDSSKLLSATPPAAEPEARKPRLNPNHGEPGHRCDIPVGTPLDSKPSSAAASPVSSSPNVIINQPANGTPATNAPLLNPKHGEPGHRCDIAVGAPLNSAPSKAVQQPSISSAPIQNALTSQAAATPATNIVTTQNAMPNTAAGTASNPTSVPKLPLQLPGANVSAGSVNGSVKLNPKHGEPGHRCGVAVGAPLN